MTDSFALLVPEARAFLRDLSDNNSRDWFRANKARYDTELKGPATHFLDTVAVDLHRLTGDPVTTKLFRPQRDVRFSKDKTPYHTHLHMLWTTDVQGRAPLGWFLGISPDYITCGAGLMSFDKDTLTHWRAAMNEQEGEKMQALVDGLLASGARIGMPELKRVPPPFDQTHPHGELLRRKGLVVWRDFSEAEIEKDGLTQTVKAVFSGLKPVQDALRPLLR